MGAQVLSNFGLVLHRFATGRRRLLVDPPMRVQNHAVNLSGALFADPPLEYVFTHAGRVPFDGEAEAAAGRSKRHDPITGIECHMSVHTQPLGLTVSTQNILLGWITRMATARALRRIDGSITDVANVKLAAETSERNLGSRRPAKFAGSLA